MALLRRAFEHKAEEFNDVLKMGRTQLQDAVPMTLGQEFTTYAVMMGEDEERLKEAALLIREINLGATAIGTGINSHPEYARLACWRLARLPGSRLITAPNLVEATQDCGGFVQLSGVLKRVAVKMSKICNDLRLLSRGPRAGLGESTCRRCRRAPRSCPARSIRSSPRWSIRLLRGDRQRRHRHLGGGGRAVAVERLRADHRR